jgi:FkbM family methyltransferase
MSTTPDRPLPLPGLLRCLQPREFPRKLGICDRLFGRALAGAGICWVRTAPGPVWKLDLGNQTHRWIVYGSYEGPAFWHWLRRDGAGTRTIVDSGANIGQTVLYFASLLPAARIFAYEPGSAARAWLTEGVAANGFTQVTIEPVGLGATASRARLATDGDSDRHGAWNKVSSIAGEPIVIATLEAELDRHGLETLDLWKLDMEGYEQEALRGASRLIESRRIRAIYVEAAGEAGRATIDFLVARGYSINGLTPSGHLTAWHQSHPYDNVLCLAPGHPAARA